jgi:NAD dependent epimerase/dehydratase family enzyme
LIYSDSKGSTGVQQPVDPTRTAEGGDLRAGLAVVILAWNHVADTIECMESVISAVGPQGLLNASSPAIRRSFLCVQDGILELPGDITSA